MAAINLTPIKSSAIVAHGHDPETGKMQVQLHNGKIYEYDDVGLDKYAAFTGAASPGSFWNSRIKPHHNHREIVKKTKD
jgi:hypothetical protein